MFVEEFEPSEDGSPGGWRLRDWSSVEDLLTFRDQQRQSASGYQLLYVLDDKHQAAYTSAHSRETHRLVMPDPESMSAEERQRYEHEGILSPERWTETVTKALRSQARDGSLDDMTGRLIAIDDPDIRLLSYYDEPDEAFVAPLTCYAVRTDDPSMAIAAQPNGYFSGDLTPIEHYLLAERLRTQFSYEIVGLGARLAAYVRPKPFDKREAAQVVASVRDMYDGMTDETAAKWAEAAADRRWFLLHYVGS